jgi:hypothetical protein
MVLLDERRRKTKAERRSEANSVDKAHFKCPVTGPGKGAGAARSLFTQGVTFLGSHFFCFVVVLRPRTQVEGIMEYLSSGPFYSR